jgi:hypothetical protein
MLQGHGAMWLNRPLVEHWEAVLRVLFGRSKATAVPLQLLVLW